MNSLLSNLSYRVAGRRSHYSRGILLLGICLLSQACSTIPSHPAVKILDGEFSAELAEAHLVRLAELGPRRFGAEAAARAQAYLEREMELAGAESTWLGTSREGDPRHLLATFPGDSEDIVMLVAPWSLLGDDRWADDAGAALLLALAPTLASGPAAYTRQLLLVEVRSPPEESGNAKKSMDSVVWESIESRTHARERVRIGAEDAIRRLEEVGKLDRLRIAIVLEPRTGPAVPRMARDLRSQPIFRSLFWETAADLGFGEVFPSDGEWRSPSGIQAALQAAGYGQVVSLVEESAPVDVAVAAAASGVMQGAQSKSGLGPIGLVTYEALVRLMERFERIDAFGK